MTDLQMRIMTKAVKIRLGNGEALDAILESYTKLSAEEKEEIRKTVRAGANAEIA